MSSYNRVVLMGNIVQDFELRHTPAGTAVTDVCLAVNDRRKVGDTWEDEVSYIDVTLWGRTAEITHQYLAKGSPILVEGRLKLDTWESEGEKRRKLKVVGERMQMMPRGESVAGVEAAAVPAGKGEDLPF